MDYTLILLTHGLSTTIDRCVESFAAMVSPRPSRQVAVIDGPGTLPPIEPMGAWEIHQGATQEGFCRATQRCWGIGSGSETDYVFHLEADFEIIQPIDLRPMAEQLDVDPNLAQMVLMRDAVSPAEIAAGGLFESRPGQYEQQWTNSPYRPEAYPFLRHRSYFSTNPSLMTRMFMLENPWPSEYERCEGLFGIDLVAAGWHFGAWGSGEPMCKHIGTRTGYGY